MVDGRGSRLFSDLNNIFKRDPFINEYDVIPVLEPKHNKSPLVLIEHKLGVELWCVSVLYKYAYDRLLQWRSKDGPDKFIEPLEISNLCRAVLLVNPECYTAWNIRKEYIESEDITISDDLRLGELILKKHPKSPETFIHRRWLLQHYLNKNLLSSNDSTQSNSSVESVEQSVGIDGISVSFLPTNHNSCNNNHSLPVQMNRDMQRTMQQEFEICWRAAEGYACNYYAWSHRIWIIQSAYSCSIQVLLSEIVQTASWFTQHVSDHSGFHYRQFLFTALIKQSHKVFEKYHVDINSLLNQEYDKSVELINTYPGHESLWYHRKFIFSCLIQQAKPENLRTSISLENGVDMKRSRVEIDVQHLIDNEVKNITCNELTSCDKHQTRFANRYLEWIRRMLTF